MTTFKTKPSVTTILKVTDPKTNETGKYSVLSVFGDKTLKLRNIETNDVLKFKYERNEDDSISIIENKGYKIEPQEEFKTISITINDVDPISLKTMSLALDNLATQINNLGIDAEEKLRLLKSIHNVSNKFNVVASILLGK